MTLAWETPGAHAAGTTSCTPAFPATPGVGDLLICGTGFGNTIDAPPLTPPGFLPIPGSERVGGSGTFNADDGPRGTKSFYRFASGSESGTLTVTGGGSGATQTTSAQIFRISKTLPNWFIRACTGLDTSAGTGLSITGDDSLGPVSGDIGLVIGSLNVDTATLSAFTLTWDGVATACTQVQQIANSSGNDQRFYCFRRALAGNATGDPVFAATLAANAAGPAAFIVIHEDVAPMWGMAM